MPSIHREATVPYSAEQMYRLVNSVRDYPEFLPWCQSCEVISENEDEIRARLEVSRGGIQKSFTTCNRLQKNKMIEIRLVDGPFEHLEGLWRFQALENGGCHIAFDLEFKFSGKLLSFALTPIFQHIGDTFVDAFCARADEVYGHAKIG